MTHCALKLVQNLYACIKLQGGAVPYTYTYLFNPSVVQLVWFQIAENEYTQPHRLSSFSLVSSTSNSVCACGSVCVGGCLCVCVCCVCLHVCVSVHMCVLIVCVCILSQLSHSTLSNHFLPAESLPSVLVGKFSSVKQPEKRQEGVLNGNDAFCACIPSSCITQRWMDTSSSVCILIWETSLRAMQSSTPSFLLVSLETHLQYCMCLDQVMSLIVQL